MCYRCFRLILLLDWPFRSSLFLKVCTSASCFFNAIGFRTHLMSNGSALICKLESNGDLVRGLVLLNCAGGMNNKAVVDDWRIKLLLPLLWLFDFLLSQRVIASALFERVKQRYILLVNISLAFLFLFKDISYFKYLLNKAGRISRISYFQFMETRMLLMKI